jgi:autotransporter-associated beta strand protein
MKIPLMLLAGAALTGTLAAQVPLASNRNVTVSEAGPAATGNVLAQPPTIQAYDFDLVGNDGASLDGWIDTLGVSGPSGVVFSSAGANDGGRGTGGFFNSGGNQDAAHPSGVMTSPPFKLQTGLSIGFQLAGGEGTANLPANLAAVPAGSTTTGFQGMALRRLANNSYVLHARRAGNNNGYQSTGWSIAQLKTINTTYPGELFVIDWIDYYHGGWGFGMVDNVAYRSGVAPGNVPLLSPPSLILGANGYGGTLEGTLDDGFAYNPLSPASPLPNLAFGTGTGFHNASGNGPAVLIYDLSPPVLDGPSNQLAVDLYGRNSNQDRDNNVEVAFLDAGGNVLGQATGLAIPDGATPHLRVSSNGIVPDGSTVAKIRVTGNDSDASPEATNNFTLMELRVAGLQAAYSGAPAVVTAVNGNPASVGQAVALPSGALLTLNANGDFTYNPNGAFNPGGAPAADSFGFTINIPGGNASSATVAVSIVDDDAPVYVDDDWSALAPGTPIADADAGTAGNQAATYGTNAFATIQAGLVAANLGAAVTLNAGNYNEIISLFDGKSLVVTGPDAAQTATLAALSAPAGTKVEVRGGSTLNLGRGAIGGLLTGSGNFTKSTAGTLTLESASTLAGTVTLDGGTVVLAGPGTPGTGPLLVNSASTLRAATTATLAGTLGGTAPLTKSGAGNLILGGSASGYTGTLTVAAGGLGIPAGITVGGSVAVNDGAGIGGEGSITGNLALGTPLGTGAILQVDQGTAGTLTAGTLTLNGVTSVTEASNTGVAIPMIAYLTPPLVDQSGAASLGRAFIPAAGGRSSVTDTAQTLAITLSVPETPVFTSVTSNNWQIGGPEANWSSTDTFFVNGDRVTFNDSVIATSGGLFGGTVTVVGNPAPGSMTFNNSVAQNYTLTGGSIGGTGGLVKNNDGLLSLLSPNTFSGGTVINGGEIFLQAGNSTRPTGAGTLTINAGGILTCGTGGTGHNQFGNHGGNNLIPIVINGGLWNPSEYNHLNSLTMTGGTVSLALSNGGDGLDLRFSGGLDPTITTLAHPGTAVIAAKATLGSPTRVNVGDGTAAVDLAYSGNIIGASSLEKLGDGFLFLSGTNTYGGTTTVTAGKLAIEDLSAIPADLTKVTVAAGAGFGGIAGPANLTDAQINAIAADVNWHAGGTSVLILDTNGATVDVGSNLAGLGFRLLAIGGGTLNLSGNVTGLVINTEGGTTVTTVPGGASNIAITGISHGAGTTPGTRKATIAFTANGVVDIYASDDLVNWGAPLATGVAAAATPFVEDNITPGKTRRFYVIVSAGTPYPAP